MLSARPEFNRSLPIHIVIGVDSMFFPFVFFLFFFNGCGEEHILSHDARTQWVNGMKKM
jgi:hypothetical protein